MPRFILIDSDSGYIWGDSAEFAAGKQSDLTPIEAAKMLDEHLEERGREYFDVKRLNGRSGYEVYRADVNGAEAVGAIQDGSDLTEIEAVEKHCEHVATIAYFEND